MNKKISDKDKKDWEDFLSKKEFLPNKDFVSINDKKIKSRSIDLHGHTLTGANEVIRDFIEHSYNNDYRKLIIVTGKILNCISGLFIPEQFHTLKILSSKKVFPVGWKF